MNEQLDQKLADRHVNSSQAGGSHHQMSEVETNEIEDEGRLIGAAKRSKHELPVLFMMMIAVLFFFIGAPIGYLGAHVVMPTIKEVILNVFSGEVDYARIGVDTTQLTFLLSTVGIMLMLAFWVVLIEGRPFRSIGFFKPRVVRKIVVGWGWGIALFCSVVFLLWLFGFAKIEDIYVNNYMIVMFILFVIAWQIQSASEEMVLRGWLLPLLAVKLNRRIAIVLSSVLFSVMHLLNHAISWIAILNIGLFGLAMAIYALKEDDIWGVCGVHAAWNCLQGSFFGLPVSGVASSSTFIVMKASGPSWLSGGEFGPEASIFTTTMLLLFIIYLLEMKRVKEQQHSKH